MNHSYIKWGLIILVIVVQLVCPSRTQKSEKGGDGGIVIEYLHVHADIHLRYARTRVMAQLWNPGSGSQETTLWVTIPKEAFITDFILEENGLSEYGHAKLTSVAQKVYSCWKKAGELIGLVRIYDADKGSNTYELTVNLKARQTVNLTLAYEGLVDKIAGGGNSFKYKFVIQVTPKNMEAVKHFQCVIQIEELGKVDSPMIPNLRSRDRSKILHQSFSILSNENENGLLRVTVEPSQIESLELAKEGLLGRAEIEYGVLVSDAGTTQKLVRDGYLVHLDSSNFRIQDPLPRHIIFVLDVSDSMFGRRLRQLKLGMRRILNSMKQTYNHHNFIDIITFASTWKLWDPIPNRKNLIPLSSDFKTAALAYIDGLEVAGSTNIHSALEMALLLAKSWINKTGDDGLPYPPTIIFFVTDGEPTAGLVGAPEILRRLKGLQSQAPIYSLAFGPEADYELCRNISAQSGGLARKIFDNGDAGLRFEEFYREATSESLQGVTFRHVFPAQPQAEVTHETFKFFFKPSKGTNMTALSVVDVPARGRVPCAEKCFMERLHMLQRINRLHQSYGRPGPGIDHCQWTPAQRRDPKMNEAIELAFKHEFVTPCTALISRGQAINKRLMEDHDCHLAN